MLVLLLLAASIINVQASIIKKNNELTRGVDEDNIYHFLNKITHGKIFNLSHASHELLEIFGYKWPDYDPKEFPPFNCSTNSSQPHVKATSVHKLTAFDVEIVAAMGDSLTAGFGAEAYTLIDLFAEYRGVSWSIGGDETLEKHITIPNILKKYNPNVIGYSTGITPALIPVSWEHLNVAVSGSTAYGLMKQAVDFLQKLKSDPHYDLKNSWKVLTIFIGGNDLCSTCRKYRDYDVLYTPENYILKMTEVLDFLLKNVPRLFVNVALAPDVTVLHQLDDLLRCRFTHSIECKCGTVMGEKARNYTLKAMVKYHKLLEDLVVHSRRYDGKDDFTVVLQPFFDSTEVPKNKDGSIDLTYWAPDCFHFSGKAHSASALALWNNMNQPVGQKKRKWTVGDAFICPTAEKPYFYTNRNSKYN